jgi:hypothetical protein
MQRSNLARADLARGFRLRLPSSQAKLLKDVSD